MNLLIETKGVLKKIGKTEQDIEFITDGETYCSWKDFVKQLEEVNGYEYDDGYGFVEVDLNLKIVGKDWYLERTEYDGAEWWEFKQIPQRPTTYRKLRYFEAKSTLNKEENN